VLRAFRAWREKFRGALAVAQAENREHARQRGWCICPAGQMGAVAGEEHADWCPKASAVGTPDGLKPHTQTVSCSGSGET
jgi:hypothetical protein